MNINNSDCKKDSVVLRTCDGSAEALLANPTTGLANQVLHIAENIQVIIVSLTMQPMNKLLKLV